MTITRRMVVSKAQEFVGTPYHHQGRIKGIGIDCCGLIIQVAKELKISNYDIDNYSSRGNGETFLKAFDENCLKRENLVEAAIVIFSLGRYPAHCGILNFSGTDFEIIHAANDPCINRVVCHRLDKSLEQRIVAIYDYPCFQQEGFF